MTRILGFTKAQCAIIILMIIGLPMWAIPFLEKAHKERSSAEYAAWVKLTGRSDITLEEFIDLQRGRLISQTSKSR